MPELPEVETIVRSLCNPADRPFAETDTIQTRPGILGRVIADSDIQWARTIAVPDIKTFQSRIKSQSVHEVTRRGKFILLKLTNDFLLFHLRMSGDIYVELNKPETIRKHDRVTFEFSDGSRLAFNDPRKFGRIWLVDDPMLVLGNLGPEPFLGELTPSFFWEMLKNRKRTIKPLLMDQTFLAGLGNIYTDEALHLAKVYPLERSDSLDLESAIRLLNSIREVLQEGIHRNGASIDWVYRGGNFQNFFRVYQRTDKPCYTCGTSITRIVIGQRGTHYCPRCQKPLSAETTEKKVDFQGI